MRLAMQHKKPDRVPVMCQLSEGYLLRNGGEEPFDMCFSPEGFARALFRVRRELGFDGILLNTMFEENWRETYDNCTVEQAANGLRYILPSGERYRVWDHQMIQENDRLTRDDLPDIEEIDEENLPIRLDYSDATVLHKIAVEQGNKEQFSVHGEIWSPLDWLCVLFGMQQAMMALVLDAEKCERILQQYVKQCIAFAKAQIDVGVDAMKISSPFAGAGFLSLPFYRRFVMPFESEVVRELHQYASDIPVYLHTCGSIGDRLELMAQSGIDGLECMDPPPLGNVELADAKKRVGGKLFLKGNMDSVNVLLNATPESLEEYVKTMLRDGAPGGGYILSSACSVAPGVKPEILKMLVPLAEMYGRYDDNGKA